MSDTDRPSEQETPDDKDCVPLPFSPCIVFNEVADKPAAPSDKLVFAIRTDANHATATIKKNLKTYLTGPAAAALPSGSLFQMPRIVNDAYRDWGHGVLRAMADCLDYNRFGLTDADRQKIDVHFYNAPALAARAATLAKTLIEPQDADLPLIHVTLDEQIVPQNDDWAEISFSRLFDFTGTQSGTYMARPGRRPLNEQIAALRDKVKALQASHNGRHIPIVLIEDNVRHAKMLNWVIGRLAAGGVLDHAKIAGISTCFCCASEDERRNIQHDGHVVPVVAAVDYGDAAVDVVTPRDLLFDGYVVQTNDKTARLPAIFMDIDKLFKIDPSKKQVFHNAVLDANLAFCRNMKTAFGITPPLSWFAGADAIAYMTRLPLDTPMEDIIRACKAPQHPPLPPERTPSL